MSTVRERRTRVRPPAQPPPTPSRWRILRSRLDTKVSPYLYIAPFFLLFTAFGVYQLGYTFWVSLTDRELLGEGEFIGLDNYRLALEDDAFLNALVNTVGMFLLSSIPQLLLALVLANALNRRMRGRTLFRLGVIIPYVTSIAAVAIVFSQLFGREYGMINYGLEMLGFEKIDWEAGRLTSWIAVAVMVDWRWTGYNALIYLAAMQSIPKDLYEAAEIDGASRRTQFWRITVPLLRPTILFTAIISTIGGLQLFTEPVIFGHGDPDGGTLGQFQTLAMLLFEQAFRRGEYGYGAALAWVLFLLIMLFAVVNFLFLRRMGGTR